MHLRESLFGAALGVAMLAAPAAHAAVTPHGLFTDGAVLQQKAKVPVWGTAANGEKVTVSINGQSESATAGQDGKWKVWLNPLKAGGPYTLKISGQNTIELKDILVGEVYVCSGQSNMEMSLGSTFNAPDAIAKSADPQLHLFTVPRATSDKPLYEVSGQWKPAGPDTVGGFSAVAYYFGRDLRKALKVPVGLIHSSWGGTVAEAWTSSGALSANPALSQMLVNYRTARRNYPFQLMAYQQTLEQYRLAVEQAKRDGKEPPKMPNPPGDPAAPGNPNRPSVLYNAMISPLLPYSIRGAIWYQGESNAGRSWEYQTLFPTLIRDWRAAWNNPDLGFYFVQLAPFYAINPEPMESGWAELREAQRLTTLRVPKTGMAVITDVGEERDIHPKKKEPVGARLALAAEAITYDMDIEYSGPTYDSLKIHGDHAVVGFKHAKGGLVAKDGKLTGFTIAGKDHKWHNATATIEGSKVVVSSPDVKDPVAVRFGWTNFPVVNLYNKAGIPASPFRTDDFPLITQPK